MNPTEDQQPYNERSFGREVQPKGTPIGSQTQDTLEQSSESSSTDKEIKELTQPRWNESSLLFGVKTAGLVLGGILCGALAIGLFPLTLTGLVLRICGSKEERNTNPYAYELNGELEDDLTSKETDKTGERLMRAGWILACPVFGFQRCVEELREELRTESVSKKTFSSLKHQAGLFITNKDEDDINYFKYYFPRLNNNDLRQLMHYITSCKDESFVVSDLRRFREDKSENIAVDQDRLKKLSDVILNELRTRKQKVRP